MNIITEGDRILCQECYDELFDINDASTHKHCNTSQACEVCDEAPSRQGYRLFECEVCHFQAKWPCRDRHSPSGETCPECGAYMTPNGSEPYSKQITDLIHKR